MRDRKTKYRRVCDERPYAVSVVIMIGDESMRVKGAGGNEKKETQMTTL